jgi:hypothetical protein
MGSPLGPTLADIFMAMLERECERHIKEFDFYGRYEDDMLIVSSSQEKTDEFFHFFNQLHPCLSLTRESEENGSLAFLDILFSRRSDGSLRRSTYRKSTWTGQYLHFQSFQPMQHKRALVRTLYYRAKRICSADTIADEIAFLEQILMKNGYPLHFIRFHGKPTTPHEKKPDVPKKPVFLRLPFKGDYLLSQTSARLKSSIRRTYPAADLRILTDTQRLPLPSFKNSCSILYSSHCIYKFQCSCGDSYLGRTDRSLQVRISEHIPKWLVKQMSQPNVPSNTQRNPSSSIAKHLMTSGHTVDFSTCFTVLHRSLKPHILKIIEALLITQLSPSLCIQKQLAVSLRLPWT